MGTISKTYTFTSGSIAYASEVNTDLDTLYTEFNGNIENVNIKSTAAIQASKLDLVGESVASNLTLTNSGNNDILDIINSGTENSIHIQQNVAGGGAGIWIQGGTNNVHNASTQFFYVSTAAAETSCNAAVAFNMQNSSSTVPLLKLYQAGSGTQITGQGNENLSNVGVWTDRTCMFEDKEDIELLTISDYVSAVNELKDWELYEFRKKAEIYGNKKDGEYPKEKKNPNSKKYRGYILDDPTTPEVLLTKDSEGNICGKAAADGVDFLATVCKGLLMRIEELEK